MAETYLTPTVATAASGWDSPSGVLAIDGSPAVQQSELTTWLVAGALTPQLLADREIVGLAVEVKHRRSGGGVPGPTLWVSDDFSGTGYLDGHATDTGQTWHTLFTVAWPADVGLSGNRAYRVYHNSHGESVQNGTETFLSDLVLPSANMAVGARFHYLGLEAPSGGGGGAGPDPGVGLGGDGDPVGTSASDPYGVGFGQAMIMARCGSGHAHYALVYNSGTHWTLQRVAGLSGANTVLDSYATPITVGGSAVGELVVSDGTVLGYVDGVLRLFATDSTYTGAGFVGLRFDGVQGPSYGVQLSEYEVRNVVGTFGLDVALGDGLGPIVAPRTIESTETYQTTTVGVGVTDDWGKPGGWTVEEVNALSIAVRRAIRAGEDSPSLREVDSVRLLVYHNPGGGSFQMRKERETSNQKTWYGREVTPGTIVPCVGRFRGLLFSLMRANFNMVMHKPQGEKMDDGGNSTRQWATGSIGGELTYDETPELFEIGLAKGVHSGGVANQRNVHTYQLVNRHHQERGSLTLEQGDQEVRNQRVAFVRAPSWEIGVNTSDTTISGSTIGHKVDNGDGTDPVGVQVSPGVNEKQTILITGVPTAGTFRLNFRGAETADLAYNVSLVNLAAALNGLITIGAGGVTVTGTVGNYVVEFVRIDSSGDVTLGTGGQRQELILRAKNNMTGGTSPDVVVSETVKGGYTEYDLIKALPEHFKVYMATTLAGLPAGKLDRVSVASFGVGDLNGHFWTVDRDNGGGPAGQAEGGSQTFRMTLNLEADSTGMGILEKIKNGGRVAMLVEGIGPMIGVTTDPHKLLIRGFFKVSGNNDYGDDDNLVMASYTLSAVEGPNGEVPTVVVENGIVTYAAS